MFFFGRSHKENQSLLLKSTDSKSVTKIPLTNVPGLKNKGKRPPLERVETVIDGSIDGEVCLMEHSPYRILKIAAKGDLKEFERLYEVDHDRLHVQDLKGLGALHHAAGKGRLVIMDFVLSHGGDINIQDSTGNTPLHTAVENKQTESIDYLVTNGADTAAHNHKQFTPLILAIHLGYVNMVEALLKHPEVNPDGTGEHGAKPLHYCASKDESECARLLIAHKAELCATCNNGYYPLHIAAYHASAKTMNVLLEHGESQGCTRAHMLSFSDKDNNNPLHAAVHSGNLKAVEVCLSAGAAVDVQQEDKSTPVHFAASQGVLEMIELMFKVEPTSTAKAMHIRDSVGMTPLHRAAIFNHETVARILLENGADINAQDNQQRTPLMVAAAKGGWNTTRYLLENGALIDMKDQQNRNFLHMGIKSGARLHQLGCELIKNIKNLLNEKDELGCTPLHYASKEGYLSTIEDLIGFGVVLNPKNNQSQSPFHFAARYGRYNTCRRLLDSEQGANIINELDNIGRSALHIATENGHTKIVSLLMQRGASVHKDYTGNTPLHRAAAKGYTRSMRVILGSHSNLLDSKNREGDTPLHLAAVENQTTAITVLLTLGAKLEKNEENVTFFDHILNSRNSEAAMAVVTHDRWRDVIELSSATYTCCFIGLIQQLPEIALEVLERCQICSGHDRKDRNFSITYNFKFLQVPIAYTREQRKLGHDVPPMLGLNAMVKFGRIDCLSHPVCVNYLKMKWNAYGMWFHFINLFIYVLFLLTLTLFVTEHSSMVNILPNIPNDTNLTTYPNSAETTEHQIEMSLATIVSLYWIVVFAFLSMVKEIIQLIYQKKRYFYDHSNLMEWSLYVTTVVFIAPFLLGHSEDYQWEAGALAVFLAWFNLLLYLQRFDFFGIYVVMFLEILSTLLQVLCVFSILIVAFGLSFFILMQKEKTHAYSTPGLSMLRSAMMMLELDYMESFNSPYTDGDSSTLHFDHLTLFMLVVFVLFMPILLMNLLIGLAVGDIEAVQRDARLKRLAKQVEHHTQLERKLPQTILEKVDKVEYTVYPNRGQQMMMSLLLKMTMDCCISGGSSRRGGPTISNSGLYEELHKQKQRMKEMSSILNKQHDLLRLVVEKMEINTEDDYRDEGASPSDSLESLQSGIKFSKSPGWFKRVNVYKQSAVISRWKKDINKDPKV